MTVIAMSRTEPDRMHVLRDLAAGRIAVNEAAQLMRLTRRHVFRLAKAYRERGPSTLKPACQAHHPCRAVGRLRQGVRCRRAYRHGALAPAYFRDDHAGAPARGGKLQARDQSA